MSLATRTTGKHIHPLMIPLLGLCSLNFYFGFWLYARLSEIHRFAPGASRVTPGRAIGMLFVPFYNLYWYPYVLFDLSRAIGKQQREHLGRVLVWPYLCMILLLAGPYLFGFGGTAFMYLGVLADDRPRSIFLAVLAWAFIIGFPTWTGMMIAQLSLNRVWARVARRSITESAGSGEARLRRERRRLLALLLCLLLFCALPLPFALECTRVLEYHPEMATSLGLVLEPPAGRQATAAEIQRTIDVVGARLEQMDVDTPRILPGTAKGEDLTIELPPAPDLDHVRAGLVTWGKLELLPVAAGTRVPYDSAERARAALDSLPGGAGGWQVMRYHGTTPGIPAERAGGWIVAARDPVVSGLDVVQATARPDPALPDRYEVGFRLDSSGGRRMAKWTRGHVGEQLAIALDDTAITAPIIRTALHADGVISGDFDSRAAHDLALVLRSGSLPLPVHVVRADPLPPQRWILRHGSRAGAWLCAWLLTIAIFYYIGHPARRAVSEV